MPGPVLAALVVPHHPDRTKADALVGANRARVRGGRVDHEPMVAALLEEIAGKERQSRRPEPLAVMPRREEDIHAGVAVVRIELLVVLDAPDDLAVVLDREPDRLVVFDPLLRDPRRVADAEPGRDGRFGEDRAQRGHVRVRNRPQDDAGAAEDRRHRGYSRRVAHDEASSDPVVRQLRERISDNDREILEAVNRRLELVRRLKEYKTSRGYGFVDQAREDWMFSYLSRANTGPLSTDGLHALFDAILDLTKREVAGEETRRAM